MFFDCFLPFGGLNADGVRHRYVHRVAMERIQLPRFQSVLPRMDKPSWLNPQLRGPQQVAAQPCDIAFPLQADWPLKEFSTPSEPQLAKLENSLAPMKA